MFPFNNEHNSCCQWVTSGPSTRLGAFQEGLHAICLYSKCNSKAPALFSFLLTFHFSHPKSSHFLILSFLSLKIQSSPSYPSCHFQKAPWATAKIQERRQGLQNIWWTRPAPEIWEEEACFRESISGALKVAVDTTPHVSPHSNILT